MFHKVFGILIMLCTYIYCTLYSICAVYSVQQKRGVGGQNKAFLCTQCDMWIVDGHHASYCPVCESWPPQPVVSHHPCFHPIWYLPFMDIDHHRDWSSMIWYFTSRWCLVTHPKLKHVQATVICKQDLYGEDAYIWKIITSWRRIATM